MSWKAIGDSVIGISHVQNGKSCEDASSFTTVALPEDKGEVLVCCASDGAGSALHAAWASSFVTRITTASLTELIESGKVVVDADIYALAETLYEALVDEARVMNVPVNEYSCTWLGGVVYPDKALFFQMGDGAIVRDDGAGHYTNLWWPHNGEYQNSTCFLIDDPNFSNLHVTQLEEVIDEVALFTDGLQMLALSMETSSVHQPFFTALFKVLRMADDGEKVAMLSRKLSEYLSSDVINNRTDDDKTLFLATRQKHEI